MNENVKLFLEKVLGAPPGTSLTAGSAGRSRAGREKALKS